MKGFRLRTAFAVLFTLFLLSAAAWAAESEAPVRAVVLYREDAVPSEMTAALSALEDVSLLWPYESLFPGAAVEAGGSGLRAIRALPGVAGLSPVRSYAPASGGGDREEEAWSEEGLALMGASELWREGLTGDGVVIAVLDSGLNTDHEAFADASLTRSPAISREDAAAYAAKKGTAGRYVSARIPFVYDYYGRDGDVSTANGHGTHVAALAAGYALNGEGRVRIRGAAPGAQLLGMKIFPDGSGAGTDDAVILRALEDAWNLGADVINLSVGAGAGFCRDDILDGAFSRAFALLAEEGVVVCCSAGNEESPAACKTWARPLPGGAYTDYGAVTSPASYRGAVAVAAAGAGAEGAFLEDYSAWGPASELHLAPALAAFGGPIVSAGAGGENTYYSDYGTSMASASASGLFAVTLQALRERGVTDRREAAAMARGLLESTARLITDEKGVPLSPRKQGSGLADLSAALASRAVLLDPLAELGDSGEGRFRMSFTVKNLSDEELWLDLETRVLTDDFLEEDGKYYSRMAPRDITGYAAVSGPASVAVPAGGETEVSLELTAGEPLQRELAEAFPNGFYVEGYVTASGGGQEVHGTFLGYCGDWDAAPAAEAVDFRHLQDEAFRLAGETHAPVTDGPLQVPEPCLNGLGAELGAQLAYLPAKGTEDPWYGRLLGANGRAAGSCGEARFAIPGQNGDAMHSMDRQLCLALYTLRNAAGAAAVVSDAETGEVYWADTAAWFAKSALDPLTGRIGPSARFAWNGTDAGGRALPGGTRVRVAVYAWTDGESAVRTAFEERVRRQRPESFRLLLDERYDRWRVMEFPAVIDSRAPAVASAGLTSSRTLAVTLRDDQYLAYVRVLDEAGELLAEEAFFPEEAGAEGTVTVDLSAWETMPEVLYLTAEDYASNTAGYALELSGDGAVSFYRTARGLLADADPSAWYWEAVDRAVSGGLMECDRSLRFQPGSGAARSDIAAALYRAGGSPVPEMSAGELPFTDLDRLPGCLDGLCWAYETGLVSGRSDGSFDGQAGVTRQELAVMLYRYAAQRDGGTADAGDLSAFPDAGRVSSWAEEGVAWAVGQGLLRGSEGLLRPRDGVTRAETAQILERFLALGTEAGE